MRMIQETIYSDENHEFARYSQDYELYQLGSYDDTKGVIDSYTPAHITNLNALKWETQPATGGAEQPALKSVSSETNIQASS